MVVVGLLGFFIIYPQLRVVLVPGLAGYVEFFREPTWVKPLLHSLQITVLSTTTAVTLGFVYAYAMVYSECRGSVSSGSSGSYRYCRHPSWWRQAIFCCLARAVLFHTGCLGNPQTCWGSAAYGVSRPSPFSRLPTSSSPMCCHVVIRP